MTGLAVLPGPVGSALVSLNAGRIINRFGKSMPAILGPTLFAIGAASWIFTVTVHPDFWTGFGPASFVTGLGGGLIQAPLYAAASSLPVVRATTGSAVLNMASQVGSAIGIAILVTLLAADEGLTGFRHAWLLIVVAMGIAAVTSVVYAASQLRGAKQVDEPLLSAVES